MYSSTPALKRYSKYNYRKRQKEEEMSHKTDSNCQRNVTSPKCRSRT